MAPMPPMVSREEMARAPPAGVRVVIFVVVGVLARPVIDFWLYIDAPLAINGRGRRVVIMMLDDPLALDDSRWSGAFVPVIALAIDRSIEIC
jgi:hypothetical protein